VRKLRLLDLFSGIGGFSLGLERSGAFETVAFCEIEEFPRKVLAKHWPKVPCYDDVRTLTAARLAADGIAVDAICGGFPCQDISTAGRGAGPAGERSGLWSEIKRLVGELGPAFVIVENVSALLSRGLGDVLGDLAALGYDAEWHCIPASSVGAHHRRDRVWIIAYPHKVGVIASDWSEACQPDEHDARCSVVRMGSQAEDVANSIGLRQSGQGKLIQPCREASIIDRQTVDAFAGSLGGIWRTEPAVGRVANGIPDRLDRLRALGNAVVPQIPELIGRAIGASIQAGGGK